MALEIGDIFPQASGSASLGAEMSNGGFSTDIRPFANVHLNSGIFHAGGVSGIIRFAAGMQSLLELGLIRLAGLEFSLDGGSSFGLGFYNEGVSNINLIHASNARRTGILSSGLFLQTVGSSLDLSSYGAGINIISSLKSGPIAVSSQENAITLTGGAAVGTAFLNHGLRFITNYTNISLEAGVVGANVGDIQLSAWAGSGQLRYRFGPHQAWYWKPSYASTGGPQNDGYFPIPHSGQILHMILANGGSAQSMQAAYNGGNEILTPLKGTATQGVIVKLPVKATGSYDDALDPYTGHTSYGLAVSGSVGGNTSLARLTSTYLHIRNSGLPLSDQNAVFIGFHNPQTDTAFAIHVSGAMSVRVPGTYTEETANRSQTSTGSHNIGVDEGFSVTTNNPSFAMDFLGAGQINFQAFGGDGQLTYRINAYEAWHWKPSYASAGGPDGDGFFPIPHSGQINQMILAAQGGGSTLQGAYNTGASIYAVNGDIILHAITGRTRMGTTSGGGTADRAPLNISGVATHLDTGTFETGDIAAYTHSQVILDTTKTTNPSTTAEASAQSLGISTLQFNTGSGVTNISVGSGISQFFNVNAQTLGTTATGVTFPAAGNNVRDKHYHVSGGSGIIIMVPGLYQAQYQGVCQKTQGTTAQGIRSYLVRNNIEIVGSRSAGTIPDATANESACNASVLFDALAKDEIALAVELTNSPASNTIQTRARGVTLILRYIGPRRATQTTLLGA